MPGSDLDQVPTGPVAIVTDSAACLPAERDRPTGVLVVPLRVLAGGMLADDDQGGLPAGFADAIRRGERLTTARPTPEMFASAYRRAADAGATAVVSVHMSGQLSGTVSSAEFAAVSAPVPVHVVDSQLIGTGLGLVVLAAARAAGAGLAAADVALAAGQCAAMTGSFFALDSPWAPPPGGRLEANWLAGRGSAGDSPAGSRSPGANAPPPAVLTSRPLLQISAGQITMLDRVRTRSAAAERLAELAADFAAGREVDIAVQHADAADRAAALADRLMAVIARVRRIYVAEAGAAITAHTGLAMLGVALAPC
jgi:fatty acid-binding protein DegV